MFIKMSVKKGIKLFKESAVSDIVKEYTQQDDRHAVSPEIPNGITP